MLAERELALAQTAICALREERVRPRQVRAVIGGVGVGVITATIVGSTMWSTTTQAQGTPRGLTVGAPFKVVDSAGRVIASIDREDGEPVLKLRGSDGKSVLEAGRLGTKVNGPFTVNDSAGRPITVVQAETTSGVANEKGQVTTATSKRGVHVLNSDGQTVGRMAVEANGNGYVLARHSSGKGMSAILSISNTGGEVLVTGSDSNVKASVKSTEGFVIYNAQGTPLGSMGAVKDKGYLELNSATGEKMVEMGSLQSGKGYVLVTPYRASVSPHGDPSVLKGGAK